MNVFRLFLCVMGLVVFLAVRHLSPPPISDPLPGPEPHMVRSPLPGLEELPPNALPGDHPMFVPVTKVINELEVGDKTIVVHDGPNGRTYQVTNEKGDLLVNGQTETEFKNTNPDLYARLQIAHKDAPGGSPPPMILELQPDGRLR